MRTSRRMTQPMTKKTIIAALAFAALVMAAEVSGSSAAAQVSQEFLGAWAPTPEKQGDAPNCRRDDNDALMEIKSRSVGYWESGCAVSAFRRLKSEKRLAEVVLSCTGEELTWRTKEIWSLQSVKSKMILVTINIQRSEQPPVPRRPSDRMREDIFVTMYVFRRGIRTPFSG